MSHKVFGYCRISTPKQSIDRQVRNIKKEFPDAVIICEEYTGTKIDRPKWSNLRSRLKAGDTVIFDSVSRMSRDATDGFKLYKELYDEGVILIFLKEPLINTETYRKALEVGVPLTGNNVDFILEGVNKYLMSLAEEQIRLAFEQAEKEVKDLRQRTREGIESARLRGRQIGHEAGTKLVTKKSIATKEVMRKHCKDFGGTLSDEEVRKLSGVSRNTFYKYKKEMKLEQLQEELQELQQQG